MSIVSLNVRDTVVYIMARMEGAGPVIGDLRQEIRAGEKFKGYTFEELKGMGAGRHDLKPRK